MIKSHETVTIEAELSGIVPGFLENRKSDLNLLKKSLETNDLKTITSIAHRIKGSSGGYGFHALSKLGAQLEKDSKENELQKVTELIQAMDVYLRTVKIIYRKPA